MARPCNACTKTVYALDERNVADSGIYHRSCFKCSTCGGQLTNLNFAEMKGILFCKPHFLQKFKLRGKYDDVVESGSTSTPSSPAVPAAAAAASTEVVEAATGAASAEERQPAVHTPSPAAVSPAADTAESPAAGIRRPSSIEVAAPAAAAAAVDDVTAATADVFITGLSVKDRIKAQTAASVSAGPPSPAPGAASPGVVAAKAAAAAAAASASSSERSSSPALAVSTPAHRSAAGAGVASSPAAGGAAATASTPVAASSSAAGSASKFGGGGTKCSKCSKTMYSAEPQITAGADVWHRECFKCTSCSSQLTLSTWASIDNNPFCKPCYTRIFKLKGSYADLGTAAADKRVASEEAAATPTVA